MVGMISMQNHFKKAFTAEQAEVLATAIVEAHDQLVTRRDFHELKDGVERLAKAQERTEGRMEQLAAAQKRTESEIHELFIAQKELTWTMKDVHKQLGGLALSVGHGLEA